MLSDDTQSAPTLVNGGLSFPRDVEFAQALDRYMTSYTAEQRRRLQRPMLGRILRRLIDTTGTPAISRGHAHGTRAVRASAAFIIKALQGLGSAMSDGGKFPSIGVM
jgi:hypothetical protein